MAWNPSPEVAAVRDAAVKLKAAVAVVLYITEDGCQMGYASYGKTMALCAHAKKFADYLYEHAEKFDPNA